MEAGFEPNLPEHKAALMFADTVLAGQGRIDASVEIAETMTIGIFRSLNAFAPAESKVPVAFIEMMAKRQRPQLVAQTKSRVVNSAAYV